MALVDGQLLAMARRTVTAERVSFDVHPYRRLRSAEIDALRDAADRYGEFLGREPDITMHRASR
jgi:hypothetical protein